MSLPLAGTSFQIIPTALWVNSWVLVSPSCLAGRAGICSRAGQHWRCAGTAMSCSAGESSKSLLNWDRRSRRQEILWRGYRINLWLHRIKSVFFFTSPLEEDLTWGNWADLNMFCFMDFAIIGWLKSLIRIKKHYLIDEPAPFTKAGEIFNRQMQRTAHRWGRLLMRDGFRAALLLYCLLKKLSVGWMCAQFKLRWETCFSFHLMLSGS